VLGDLTTARWENEFDLIIMTGHAFQVLTDDEDLRVSLASIRSALTSDGRFIFETRNPLVRGWEDWVPENAMEIEDASGASVHMEHSVGMPIEGELVSFTATFSSPSWDAPRISRSTLRFLDNASLSMFVTEAGMDVAEQFGYWNRQPLTDSSPEIITIARPQAK
jgi:SAM-dependent methyltransferase